MSKSKSRQPSKQNTGTGMTPRRESDAALAEKTSSTSSASTATRPAQSTNKGLSRDGAKYERRQAERQQRYLAQRRRRRNRLITLAVIAVIVIGGGLGGFFIYQSQIAKAKNTTVANPTPFQEAIFDNDDPPVDNVYCDQLEQQVEHIHAHLSIWINGSLSPVAQYIGIPQTSNPSTGQPAATCYYWLHTHDTSGVIHIEAPSLEPFTLGQFLDEWDEQFSSLGFPSQLLLTSGWTIWLNGKPYHGALDSVPLTAHALITVAYNSPKAKPDTTYAWNGL